MSYLVAFIVLLPGFALAFLIFRGLVRELVHVRNAKRAAVARIGARRTMLRAVDSLRRIRQGDGQAADVHNLVGAAILGNVACAITLSQLSAAADLRDVPTKGAQALAWLMFAARHNPGNEYVGKMLEEVIPLVTPPTIAAAKSLCAKMNARRESFVGSFAKE